MERYLNLRLNDLLFWLVIILLCSSCTVSRYEMVSMGSEGDFIKSPSSAIKVKNDGTLKHQYCYIIFYGLTGKYQDILNRLPDCEAWSGNTDYFLSSENQKKLKNKLSSPKSHPLFYLFDTVVSTKTNYKSATLNKEKSIYFLQFDYSILTKGTADQVVNNFNQLSNDLLKEAANLEGNTANNWPVSICQNILESIWEVILIPERASLRRFAYHVDEKASFVLLSSQIGMKVDFQNLYSAKASSSKPEKWNYNLEYQSIISFYRTEDGLLKQTPFLNIEKDKSNNLPSNSPKDETDATENLQASSADLQLSDNTNKQNFIGLYQNYMKRNVYSSSEGTNNGTINKDDDLFIGNSIILLNKKLDNLLAIDGSNIKATFGSGQLLYHNYSRNLITPIIYIHLNGSLIPVTLGTTLGMLNQYYKTGKSFSFHRQFKEKYYLMKGWNSSTLLLPGDRINF